MIRPLHRPTLLPLLALVATLSASSLHAQTPIYWQGGAGSLNNANYSNGTTTGLAPTSNDLVWFGAAGTGTLSAESATFARLRIGHTEATGTGVGTVTVSNGAAINIVGGGGEGSVATTSGLVVGNIQSGTLVIDGAGSSVTSNDYILIGAAPNQPNRNGTVRITNGGSLIAAASNINISFTTSTSNNGMPGHLIVENGYVGVTGDGGDLNIGTRNSTATFRLDSGVVEVADAVDVANQNSGANNHSTFTINGGTFTNFGFFFSGRGASTNAAVNINGGVLNVGARYLMGSGTAKGVTTNHTAGTLNTGLDVRVGDVGDVGVTDATYNLSGTGVINSTSGAIVARQGTGRFLQTGGEANFWDVVAIGNRDTATGAANGLYKISGGALKAGAMIGTNALSIAPNGTGEFRVVGDDSTIDVYGNLLVNNTANGVGTLAFELESGDLLSQINVTNAATFQSGAKLVFDVTSAVPTQTTYNLLTATSITDEGLAFTGPAGWNYQIVAGGAGQILQAFGPLLAVENADFNDDGKVDGNDFLAWQRNLGKGSAATLAEGDANGDGAVNAADLNIWKTQFGNGAAAPATAAVPEPAALGLALLAACRLARFRRK